MKKIIFSSGLPRAMTTLFCNILANNPAIGGGETSPLLEYLVSARNVFSRTPEVQSALTQDVVTKAYLGFLRQGMQGYAESITDKSIYLDKSRGWMHYSEFLHKIIPDAKIIILVRDLRGIIASLEKKRREHAHIMDAREMLQGRDFITMENRVSSFLNDLPLNPALTRLYAAIQTEEIKKMHIVRAEDLCSKPLETMLKVYEYLEIPYYDLDYNKIQQVTIENDRIPDYAIYGDHKIRSEVKPMVKDYEQVLGKDICNQIKQGNQWFFDYFKYY
jgi:sulfotransferase